MSDIEPHPLSENGIMSRQWTNNVIFTRQVLSSNFHVTYDTDSNTIDDVVNIHLNLQ